MKKILLLTLIFIGNCVFANPEKIDMTKWKYNSVENVFYQLGIKYCDNPADEKFAKLAIFVPSNYFICTNNGDETYSCQINKTAKIKNYTPKTAPIVMPAYESNPALTEYKSVWEYTNEGFVYVYAGSRGREYGAPSGVVDLKAAVKYIKFNKNIIPGNKIFSFGLGEGGTKSLLLGVTGDDKLYKPYLKQIGAVEKLSDSIYASMAWCPITNPDTANIEYEWNMGFSRKNMDENTKKISENMAKEYAIYLNNVQFRDNNGYLLELRPTNKGIYQAGTYYNYLEKIVNQSLTNFLADNLFPIDMDEYGKEYLNNEVYEEIKPQEPEISEETSKVEISKEANNKEISENDDKIIEENLENPEKTVAENDEKTKEIVEKKVSHIMQNGEDYINWLNSKKKWINYNPETYSVQILSLKDFVENMKPATKPVGAFDGLKREQAENILFGIGDSKGLHFDRNTEKILKDTEYSKDFEKDFEKVDFLGNTVDIRRNMYNPMYYILPSSAGYRSSKVAKYFRIRTGLSQTDTALTTEVNLALALKKYCGEKNIDFETVWAMGHTKAERRGTPSENFIKWVKNINK